MFKSFSNTSLNLPLKGTVSRDRIQIFWPLLSLSSSKTWLEFYIQFTTFNIFDGVIRFGTTHTLQCSNLKIVAEPANFTSERKSIPFFLLGLLCEKLSALFYFTREHNSNHEMNILSLFLQEIILQFALFSFSSEHCVIDDKTIKGHSAAQKI